jgi:hypothetical protein
LTPLLYFTKNGVTYVRSVTTQEAKEMSDWQYEANNPDNIGGNVSMDTVIENPTITVIGLFRGGRLVRCDWNGMQHSLSDKTLEAVKTLGINVIDDASNYLFSGPVL